MPASGRGNDRRIDPWYDYLAVPLAPIALLAQLVALFARRGSVRAAALVGTPFAIGAMFAYVSSTPVRADEGVDIGSGLLVLWLVASVALSLAGAVAEVFRAGGRGS